MGVIDESENTKIPNNNWIANSSMSWLKKRRETYVKMERWTLKWKCVVWNCAFFSGDLRGKTNIINKPPPCLCVCKLLHHTLCIVSYRWRRRGEGREMKFHRNIRGIAKHRQQKNLLQKESPTDAVYLQILLWETNTMHTRYLLICNIYIFVLIAPHYKKYNGKKTTFMVLLKKYQSLFMELYTSTVFPSHMPDFR